VCLWWISIAEVDERMMAEHRRLHTEEVARKEEFWAQKKQERRAARMEKRRKKAWLDTEINNPNTELDDEDPRCLDYSFLTSKESIDEE
jgi:hypothetical protein